MNRAFFLDRDGVINIDKGYVYRVEDFEFRDGIFKVLRELQNRGYILIIVTNQSGIGRGYYSLEDFKILNEWMLKAFENNGIEIAKVYYCPHRPEDDCDCRKPKPRLILEAAREFNVNLKESWIVGDKETDIWAGINAGILNTILLLDRKEKNRKEISVIPKFVVSSIWEILTVIHNV